MKRIWVLIIWVKTPKQNRLTTQNVSREDYPSDGNLGVENLGGDNLGDANLGEETKTKIALPSKMFRVEIIRVIRIWLKSFSLSFCTVWFHIFDKSATSNYFIHYFEFSLMLRNLGANYYKNRFNSCNSLNKLAQKMLFNFKSSVLFYSNFPRGVKHCPYYCSGTLIGMLLRLPLLFFVISFWVLAHI